ncbi:hypothetical protein ACG7TL_007473 [Trametes sanguinea]
MQRILVPSSKLQVVFSKSASNNSPMSTLSRSASGSPDPAAREAKAAAEAAARNAHKATIEQVRSLYRAIIFKPPYCYGTVPLNEDDFVLFYGKDENARRINLSHATNEQLQHLAETCDPATYGLGGEDVLDETYRKAGKLDARHFSLNWSPAQVGLLDIVRDQLFFETASRRIPSDKATTIRAELYKLNVYGEPLNRPPGSSRYADRQAYAWIIKGPQSFFKPHVDTPRDDTMFGSIVIVFPTMHEGGELVLRSYYKLDDETRQDQWTVDSSSLLSQTNASSIAYIAFFSDIEHEVLPVQSGYRVTITYNLHFVPEPDDAQVLPQPQSIPSHEDKFRLRFQRLLDDPSFLPDGGNLLFCLWHQYPLPKHTEATPLEESRAALRGVRLKGSDAMMRRVVRSLDLHASLRIVVYDRAQYADFSDYCVMCDHAVHLKRTQFPSDSLADYLVREHNGTLINRPLSRLGPEPFLDRWLPRLAAKSEIDGATDPDQDQERRMQVYWVTPQLLIFPDDRGESVGQTSYMAYGNEATMALAYWKVSMLVRRGSLTKASGMDQPEPVMIEVDLVGDWDVLPLHSVK